MERRRNLVIVCFVDLPIEKSTTRSAYNRMCDAMHTITRDKSSCPASKESYDSRPVNDSRRSIHGATAYLRFSTFQVRVHVVHAIRNPNTRPREIFTRLALSV